VAGSTAAVLRRVRLPGGHQLATLDELLTAASRHGKRRVVVEAKACPDAGFAKDRRDATLPRLRDREQLAKARELRVASDHRRVDATQTAAGRAFLQSGDLVRLHGVRLALQIECADVDRLDEGSDEAVRRAADEDGARPRQGLHPCGHVHRVAHRGVLARGVGAHDADHDRPRVDADPHL